MLFTNLALILLYWQWRPFGSVIWDVSGGVLAYLLYAVCGLGWIVVLISTFLIDHFELSGLRQVGCHGRGVPLPQKELRTPAFYKHVRHPIYFGFLLAFWATPKMTTAHLLFAQLRRPAISSSARCLKSAISSPTFKRLIVTTASACQCYCQPCGGGLIEVSRARN